MQNMCWDNGKEIFLLGIRFFYNKTYYILLFKNINIFSFVLSYNKRALFFCMISDRHIQMASALVRSVFPSQKVFIFGGSLRKKIYGDVDIAIEGIDNVKLLFQLYDVFEDSNFPRPVDLVDFDKASDSFRSYVLSHEKKIWI